MKKGARGRSNEHRTIDYLAKQNFVAVRTGASKGMGDCDVLAYHIHTGEVKHVQSKSNHHYTQSDLQVLRTLRKLVTASNVSIELWDWPNNKHTPKITIIEKELTTQEETKQEDPFAKLFGELDDIQKYNSF
jgi:hypothetical protein